MKNMLYIMMLVFFIMLIPIVVFLMFIGFFADPLQAMGIGRVVVSLLGYLVSMAVACLNYCLIHHIMSKRMKADSAEA